MISRFFPSLHPRRVGLRGSALAATMMVVAALAVFLSISALITSQFGRYAGRQQGDSDLKTATDAAMEYAYAQWQTTTSATFNKTGVAPTSADFPTAMNTALLNTLNSSSLAYSSSGITFSNLSIQLAAANGTADTTSTVAKGTATSNVPNYPGWTGQSYNYLITVTAAPASTGYHYGFFGAGATAGSGSPSLKVSRMFQVTQVPLFQAAIFYQNKLEIHPGADMTVSGLVHTNGDLWARGFQKLQFKSNVSYVGGYNEKGDSSVTKGWDGSGYGIIPGVTSGYTDIPYVTWSDGLTSTNSTAKASQLNQVSPINPFGNTSTASNGLHDLIEKPTSTTITSNQLAYNNASLIIEVDSSNLTNGSSAITLKDGDGKVLTDTTDISNVTKAINSGKVTTVWDQREGDNITITTLDMTKLAAATVPASGAKSLTALQTAFSTSSGIAAGTVYIRDVATSKAEKAVRLINGRNLGQDVSVATDQGLYIQGDYNTGGTKASDVPSNVSNTDGSAVPQATGYNRYSSAVMADAVTILSNNWNDSNASSNLSSRTATATTVNTAILSGDVPSNYNNNKTASGGAHNFPRFLENWNGINFTYWGSLVEAFRSETFDGLWQTGNVYYWPDRKWNFDINFLTKQPPGVPNGIQYSRGRWQRS